MEPRPDLDESSHRLNLSVLRFLVRRGPIADQGRQSHG